MKLVIFLGFAFNLLASLASHAAIVEVSSVYQDVGKADRKLKVSGSGLAIMDGSRQFVFTASHVSQGDDLKILFNGLPAKVVGRAVGDSSDLELIEVTGLDPSLIRGRIEDGQLVYQDDGGRKRWIDAHNFVPLLASINDPGLDVDNAFAKTRTTVLGMDYFMGLLHGDALVQPGTSGAPLITEIPDPKKWKAKTAPYDMREGLSKITPGKLAVRGIAIRRERFFTHASFVPVPQMRRLFSAYMKGTPPSPKIRWQAQGALLYRVDLDGGLRETNAFASSTAGSTVVDSGNGVTMEGGDLSTLNEDTPKDFLAKVSAFPTFGDTPVMYWILTMRHPKTSFLINFWCWFDMEFYGTLSRFMFATRQPEGSNMDLVSQLYPRFNQRRDFEVTAPAYIRVDRAGALIRLALTGGDQLEFQLNREGVLCEKGACPDRFAPVIEVPSSKGQVYFVDLHELFFVDSGRAMLEGLRPLGKGDLSEDERQSIVYDALQGEVALPRLGYRKRRSNLTRPMSLQEGIETIVQWDTRSVASRPQSKSSLPARYNTLSRAHVSDHEPYPRP